MLRCVLRRRTPQVPVRRILSCCVAGWTLRAEGTAGSRTESSCAWVSVLWRRAPTGRLPRRAPSGCSSLWRAAVSLLHGAESCLCGGFARRGFYSTRQHGARTVTPLAHSALLWLRALPRQGWKCPASIGLPPRRGGLCPPGSCGGVSQPAHSCGASPTPSAPLCCGFHPGKAVQPLRLLKISSFSWRDWGTFIF